jgi:hypothetical protein
LEFAATALKRSRFVRSKPRNKRLQGEERSNTLRVNRFQQSRDVGGFSQWLGAKEKGKQAPLRLAVA